jgi:hypothetical protein
MDVSPAAAVTPLQSGYAFRVVTANNAASALPFTA